MNGRSSVFVDRGAGLEQVVSPFQSEEQVRRLAVRLASQAGRRLDDAAPWVHARLPGGARLHAVLPPLVQGGTHISVRVPRRTALSLDDLVRVGSVPPGWAAIVLSLVRRRVAFLVTGGTGCGKTTMLAALLAEVDPRERIVVVEDAAELLVDHPHVVRLEGRVANVEGAGAVAMTDLVRQALRMRPDRLVVGEVRGAEVRDLLAAMNTGHEGGASTVHANSPGDLPARLEALGALAGLDRAAVAAQAVSAIQVVLHMARSGAGRQLQQISVVEPGRAGLRVMTALHAREPAARRPGWPALEWLLSCERGGEFGGEVGGEGGEVEVGGGRAVTRGPDVQDARR